MCLRACRCLDPSNKPSKPPKPPKQAPRGRVYPPPTPSHRPGLLGFSFSWRCLDPLDTSKYVGKMNIFCLWTRLGRTRSDMICITRAIRCLYATFGIPSFSFRPVSSINFTKDPMFSIELEVISVVANPKGGNQALSIRIRGRCFLTFS